MQGNNMKTYIAPLSVNTTFEKGDVSNFHVIITDFARRSDRRMLAVGKALWDIITEHKVPVRIEHPTDSQLIGFAECLTFLQHNVRIEENSREVTIFTENSTRNYDRHKVHYLTTN